MPIDPVLEAPRADTPVRVALGLIRAYQLLFSWMYAGSCRFMPSCSHYAAESIRRFGVARGVAQAARRLVRCHPFGAHGIDPVPDLAPPERRRGRPASLDQPRPDRQSI
jgi:putative membrane protein insertion efficiency factor